VLVGYFTSWRVGRERERVLTFECHSGYSAIETLLGCCLGLVTIDVYLCIVHLASWPTLDDCCSS